MTRSSKAGSSQAQQPAVAGSTRSLVRRLTYADSLGAVSPSAVLFRGAILCRCPHPLTEMETVGHREAHNWPPVQNIPSPGVWPRSPGRAGKIPGPGAYPTLHNRILITWAILMQIPQQASSAGSNPSVTLSHSPTQCYAHGEESVNNLKC